MCCLKNRGRTLFCLYQNKAWHILKEQSTSQAQEALVLLWSQARSAQCLRSSSAWAVGAAAEQGGHCTDRQTDSRPGAADPTGTAPCPAHSCLCPEERLPGPEPLCAGSSVPSPLWPDWWSCEGLVALWGRSVVQAHQSCSSSVCVQCWWECGVSAQLLCSAPLLTPECVRGDLMDPECRSGSCYRDKRKLWDGLAKQQSSDPAMSGVL